MLVRATLIVSSATTALPEDEPPLHAELFSALQMEQHGRVLANAHKLAPARGRDLLLARLTENDHIISAACSILTEAIKAGRQVTPAAEWLLDNFYLIEEQIRTAKRHLPEGYSKELPRLLRGPSAGRPRVYDIALEIISHGDGRFDREGLSRFMAAYQEHTPLQLGELWAIPIMLRLALIENLRRVAARLASARRNRNLADAWADRMAETAAKEPCDLILEVADMARSGPPMDSAFVAELVRRLQELSPTLTLPLTWLAQRLAESGESIEQLIELEGQRQAASQVAISNSIASLRLIGAVDWREFVETMSMTEHSLRLDPAGVYAAMDFSTRDHYRHVVEKIARGSPLSEVGVAGLAIDLAGRNRGASLAAGTVDRSAHVGYFLIDEGLPELERAAAFVVPAVERIRRIGAGAPLAVYLGSIAALTLGATGLLLAFAWRGGAGAALLALLGLLGLIATSQLALSLVNWIATLMVLPRPLARMDFSKGIPLQSRTLVVVPTMLFSSEGVARLCEAMEVRFLANRDDNLRFCLLTDVGDAGTEILPADAALVDLACRHIADLNARYPRIEGDIFLLLHRPRRWNQQENTWMGFERKRGKLAQLNAFLRGGAGEAFSAIAGDTTGLETVRYVITLDTDTLLPRDAASKFAATMAHPLNQAQYDASSQRVTHGYGILQPRVAISLPGAEASRYELLCAGEAGIDPYTRTVSDVYQDVFGEGSFIGKGIYDVDAFEQVMGGCMPQNRILSHDLLEGCYARAGLLSDVQLFEDYPSSTSADARRRHRWIRGDWQIASWMLPQVPGAGGAALPNPLSPLSRWKLFDNLRRSVLPVALTALLLLGWTVLSAPWFWTGVVLAILLIPPVFALLLALPRKSPEVGAGQHVAALLHAAKLDMVRAGLTLAFLPFEAMLHLDAILRTQWRILVSHQRLLEWTPSSEIDRQPGKGLLALIRTMWVGPVIGMACAAWLMLTNSLALAVAAPILLLWWASPLIAHWISQPNRRREASLSSEQTRYLQALSRKTWLFFETYVGAEDNWLPPDNVQEYPVAAIAHRTSPTNMGLSLLANLAAWDFGYVTVGQVLERCENTLRSMGKLARYRGHFYNWYDTRALTPMNPLYISTVDSGNLAGHLLTLRPGLIELIDQPILAPGVFSGLRDTFGQLQACAKGAVLEPLRPLALELETLCESAPGKLAAAYDSLHRMHASAAAFAAGVANLPETALRDWSCALAGQCARHLDELTTLAPWLQHPAAAGWILALPALGEIPTLQTLARLHGTLTGVMQVDGGAELALLLEEAGERADSRIRHIGELAAEATAMAQMDYQFLYDPATHLLAIGYNATDRRRDVSYYDLLASEARLTTFIAIAQGQLPQESWFALGRQLTVADGGPVLLSWSGSMFEYLMPLLVMPNFDKTLLDQTYHAVVASQIAYGERRGVPWGVSESGYHHFDASLNYQYRAFGVPGLGFKRGLGDDLVIAPYAAMMALMVAPELACANLQAMSALGFEGQFGFHEAIDYTPARLPRGETRVVIRSWMVHHQGMGFLALAYLLKQRPMQRRFASEPLFQATMSLLHERVPRATISDATMMAQADIRIATAEQEMPMRILHHADSPTPHVQLLSNGRYHVMVTGAGGSASRWHDLAVTRWREDSTRDHWGSFCYVRDLDDGSFWSTAFQPTLVQPSSYEVIFSEGRAEFRRRDKQIETHTEIVVSPEDDIELRRTRITNRSRQRKTIELTSYAEVVLAPPAADAMHPAFSNLFVQTEILAERNAILCTRRPRSIDERMPWMFHLMTVHGAQVTAISFETDRMQFIGRGNDVAAPAALQSRQPLSGSQGSVLDPIVAIRYQITLEAEQSATFDLVTGVAESREICLSLIDKYQDRHMAGRVFELAWTHSQVVLRQLNASEADAQLYGRLANSVLFVNPLLRADPAVLSRNQRGQSGLWASAISGDLPIVLVQVHEEKNIELVRQLVQAHAYWRSRGLAVDLVIWNEEHNGYRQQLQEQILGLISSVTGAHALDHPGGIFVRHGDQISGEDRILFESVACVILSDSRGTLAEQIARRNTSDPRDFRLPRLIPTITTAVAIVQAQPGARAPALILANGIGGFTPDGREYVITTSSAQSTPMPWSNVMANAQFGSVVSESGQAYTWGENAHEFRLTPWANDAVCDSGGEVFYLRDQESGHCWSPTALPRRGRGDYVTRHGFGYSVFEHVEDGIVSSLTVYVALDASIKYSVLKVRNDSDLQRKLSATGYVEWVLGDVRPKSAMHIVTEIDPATGVLTARNPYNPEFAGRVGFFDVDAATRSVSGDRLEFIGRNRSLRDPAAMERVRLSNKVGAGLDPCAALQVPFELLPGQEREIVFLLGVADTRQVNFSELVQARRGAPAAHAALLAVHAYWKHTLGAVQIETPDAALNVLANGWLMVQTIACRLWARSGYYQSGGAFGFRDQLQDAMALVHCAPELLRDHLLLCAAHQFVEGDVQHWWHPPNDRGVRTHCSDDYLWLPYALCRYVTATGDSTVLQEAAPFIEGRAVNPDEDSYYDLPLRSAEIASLYQHGVRAIEHGLRFGAHGLSLIGSCDWNDGMDKVGAAGRGESVWLSFFLHDVLTQFMPIATLQGDVAFAQRCQSEAARLRENIERNGWDGQWYRRAYFDDGTPLGSAANVECQIDSISQSWSVLSGAGAPDRSRMAMEAVDRRLVRRADSLVQLLDPPFDKSDQNPGYIRGYVPGVRENGGQYTHAAIWSAMAFAKMGDPARAWELLRMINPVNHASSKEEVARYKVEPYVIAADVYAAAPHVGRGGWTWYTGSSGWMYRLIVESLLGLEREGEHLHIRPTMPSDWPGFTMHYRFGATMYRIVVRRAMPEEGPEVLMQDGLWQLAPSIRLQDDGREHVIEVRVAATEATQ